MRPLHNLDRTPVLYQINKPSQQSI